MPGEVHDLDLVGGADHGVGDGLPLHGAGDLADDVAEGLHVLDVHGRDDADARGEERLNVLPPLLVLAAGGVRVRELVDQGDVGGPGDDGVESMSSRDTPRCSTTRRGTTSSPSTRAAVAARSWVSTTATTTSRPSACMRCPSSSIVNVLPTPGPRRAGPAICLASRGHPLAVRCDALPVVRGLRATHVLALPSRGGCLLQPTASAATAARSASGPSTAKGTVDAANAPASPSQDHDPRVTRLRPSPSVSTTASSGRNGVIRAASSARTSTEPVHGQTSSRSDPRNRADTNAAASPPVPDAG